MHALTDVSRECGDVHPLYRGPRPQQEEDDHEVQLDNNLFDGPFIVTFSFTFFWVISVSAVIIILLRKL